MADYQTVVWQPTKEFIEQSNLKQYQQWLLKKKGLSFERYDELWEWSVNHVPDFWESLWEYFDVQHSKPYQSVLSSMDMPGPDWFKGAELNYAEHIFRAQTEEHPALVFASEKDHPTTVSWHELHTKVAKLRTYLKQQGIGKGDRVAAYLPNIPEAIMAFLAVNSLGAIWSCCSPDFGVSTVIDRFSQIEPSLLIAANGYQYGSKKLNRIQEARTISEEISSIEEVIMIPYMEDMPLPRRSNFTPWQNILKTDEEPLEFEQLPFSHPIWVLYSSGTTGKPKAITHSHGGVLLEHLKYLHLQNDVKKGEYFFWFTTTGWMMWNFLQASMLAGGVPVLYDGSPGYPDLNTLWKLSEEIPIHHFGTSAPYLVACMKEELKPGTDFDLSKLRSIGSTGAPLPPEAFDWVYETVSDKVWLCSMSGGTDVCTAFVGGTPYEPVHRGTIQCRALGCDLRALNEDGEEVFGQLGEMVISKPMPSMPVFFWGDDDHRRYKASYFEKFRGKWCHGDWIKVFNNGSLIIQGRSDATLNRKGVRIGTAEIYAVLDKIPGIKDSLIVNLEQADGDDVMPLFVMLEEGYNLEGLAPTIKSELKSQCSPRHVPDQIIAVPDIPYTLSGKKMEVPIKKVLMGMDAAKSMNKDAARNPEAIDYFISLREELING
ncbi:MAG: acetoacetate--CoA ligase [Balneolaceae bacterium]|nr:acetoacetate--CoA ligase [Balneolaceae bacterium]